MFYQKTSTPVSVTPINGQDSVAFTPNSSRYQSTECVLYGSVFAAQKNHLLRRLRGLCDPGISTFQEHNMCFKLKTGADSPVQVQMRRRFNNDSLYWHCRYIGIPDANDKEPVIIRKTIDSMVFSTNMMEFVKTMEYEYIADGWMFTKSDIRVLVYKVQHTDIIGNYLKDNLKNLTNSLLVEANIILPDGQPHTKAAKMLKEFAEQLVPLCELKKIDYMKDAYSNFL